MVAKFEARSFYFIMFFGHLFKFSGRNRYIALLASYHLKSSHFTGLDRVGYGKSVRERSGEELLNFQQTKVTQSLLLAKGKGVGNDFHSVQ